MNSNKQHVPATSSETTPSSTTEPLLQVKSGLKAGETNSTTQGNPTQPKPRTSQVAVAIDVDGGDVGFPD